MALTDIAIKNARPSDKAYKLFDGGGLFLLITPANQKYWRLKYRHSGKEKLLALGVYPEVSLAAARKKREEARDSLAQGADPSAQRKEVKRLAILSAATSFEAVAREWFESQRGGWSAGYAEKVIGSLEGDVFPTLGDMPIADIEAHTLVGVLRAVEARGVRETAKRILQRTRAVFQYGIMTGRCARNPASDVDAQVILKKGPAVQHMARIRPLELPTLMRDIATYEGEPVTRLALELMALTFVRTAELIGATWHEFNEDAREWRIPASRMKMRTPHIVPLSRQAMSVLEELRQINGAREFVFHSPQGRKPISNNTMLYALYRMGYKSRMTGHGFRGLAATTLREMGYTRDLVDRQLAHAERNQVTAAYVHAEYLQDRRKMMQHWADYIDAARRGAKVIPGKFETAA
ncbi:tyrosine-type recombinase/integrase [Pandoraea communis]|uniref:tyrosine-type recombinase/integrase n=1 Tax=Pandoraea communis TaxID=2508297 RepID=UPI0025A4D039|nr:integrase arm-type DNA-binding domain-containing protein [Pandoraea communis]MDM8358822.1 tyrosine-type recombinase/integrase [Pandoraea communis]